MKALAISIIATAIVISGVILVMRQNEPSNAKAAVRIENGIQIIEIKAKGGYSPRTIEAQANIPTTLSVATANTFDCSSALYIPSINYRKSLPVSGVTTIDLPPQDPGTRFQGMCSMGMYSFTIDFK